MSTLYVGLDVHKLSIAISTAQDGRDGPVEFLGELPNTPTDLVKLAKRLARDGDQLEFCYEAGCCGYGIYRQLTELGHGCVPSERSSGDSIRRAGITKTGNNEARRMGDERLGIRDLGLGLGGLGLDDVEPGLSDIELVVGDGEPGLRQIGSRPHGRQRRLQRFDIIRQGLWHGVHGPMES
jgi:hypothetical protein